MISNTLIRLISEYKCSLFFLCFLFLLHYTIWKVKIQQKTYGVSKRVGFNVANLPSDVTKSEAFTVDLMAKALGVKAYVRKGLKGNAEYNRATGEVPIDVTFEREVEINGKKQKVSIVFHAAHEMAMHRVIDLAPEEGRAFVYAMYNHLAGNEPSVYTLADEKRSAYAEQDVEISLAEAMEEISANNILYLYNNDEAKFRKAIYNIVNGTDAKAKQGLRKYIDYLNNIIKKSVTSLQSRHKKGQTLRLNLMKSQGFGICLKPHLQRL